VIPPLVVPAPWAWAQHGPLWLLLEGAVPRLLLHRRSGWWEVSHADGTVIRDGVTEVRLAAALNDVYPRLSLEVPDANDAP
jgi:hypothetical protein